MNAPFSSTAKLVVMNPKEYRNIIETWHNANISIVSTNGCFDILHPGHIETLEYARSLGQLLIVGIDTDENVRKLKGAGRPIMGFTDRARVIAALSAVDLVIPIEDVVTFVRMVSPTYHVKGGDYGDKDLIERETVENLGGTVVCAPFYEGLSTTKIITKIHSL
jgi:D-beta-D-heptose 7-phosphate kinase/D-beta-D-heptose 1-phosphate adenosyltransferase